MSDDLIQAAEPVEKKVEAPLPQGHGGILKQLPQALRRVSQLGFAAFIALVAIQFEQAGEGSGIVLPEPEAFCPFGGLETIYLFITSGGNTLRLTSLSNVALIIAVLLSAVLARNAFCGWICPLGFLQDLVRTGSGCIPGLRRAIRRFGRAIGWLAGLDSALRYLKYFVLIWTVGGASLYGYMVFRDYDPWAALLDIGRPAVGFGFIVLLITLVASIFIARPWCRYACPLGAIAGLFGRISPVFIKRDAHTCTLCGLCQQACPMGLPVSTASEIRHTDCNACLECLEVCPSEGALSLAVGTPVSGQRGKLINSLAFGIAALAIFMGSIQVAQFTGFWSVSRKIPTGITVDEIRGSMMLKDISAAYKVPVEEILDAFGLPRDTPPTTQVKDLRSGTFSPGALREWLRNRVSRR